MPSNESPQDDFLNTAVKHRLLTPEQVSELRDESLSAGTKVREMAIRKGWLNGRKLDMLNSLESPLSVAPGFRVESVLGVGGFGVVFKATQLNLDRIVALKTIHLAELGDQSTHQRFEREAKIIGQLRHPNIIAAYDFGSHDDRLFLSMEYVQGLDADRTLTRRGPFDEYTTWQIIRQVSMALAYTAEHGVIHRDIKPGNLMLTEAPVGYNLPHDVPLVKVADFGLACFNENHLLNSRITVAESTVGTPFYMAPEQLIAEDVDQRADIYALGVTAWQLLTGHPPMKDDAPISIISKKTRGDDSWLDNPPPQVSPTSIDLIRKMCAHDRELRVENHPRLLTRIDRALAACNSGTSELPDAGIPTVAVAIPETDNVEPRFKSPALLDDVRASDFGSDRSRTAGAIHAQSSSGKSPADSSSSAPAQSRADRGIAPEGPDPSNLHKSTKRKHVGMAVAFLVFLVLLIAIVSFPESKGNRASTGHHEEILGEFSGPPNFLFNGTSVNPRQPVSGKWDISKGLEQGSVLAGNGSRTFDCVGLDGQPLLYFRFGCGFLHHQADSISFHIHTHQSGDLGHVELQPEQAVFFQNIQGDRPLEIGRNPIRQFGDESQGYHQIRLERHVNVWIAYLDGHSLGEIYCEDVSPANIELVVHGSGNAHFEQIRVTPYKHVKN